MRNSEAIANLAKAQEARGAALDHVAEGSIHAAAGAVLRGLALLCQEIEQIGKDSEGAPLRIRFR
jgi:phage FluMu protein gp41